MNGVPYWVAEIETRSRGLPVLLVEGEDDVRLFRYFLGQHKPGWDSRLYIAAAGGKQHVLSGVKRNRPEWIGVVDKDEWSPEDLERETAGTPHLRQIPRFCIESYFCHPAELWAALPPVQKERVNGDEHRLAGPIVEALPDWVAHGAMWRVLRRFYHDTRLPAELEDRPVIDEDQILQILQEWHNHLAPDKVLGQYHTELNSARQLSQDEQLCTYVHGKKFYNAVVVQMALNPLFGQQNADYWLDEFRDASMPPPQDLRELLDWILSFVPQPNN